MSGMRGMWLVAKREIMERGRSRAYLLTTGFTILLVLGAVLLPEIVDDGTDEVKIGTIGTGNQEILETAIGLANAGIEEGAPPRLDIETVEFDAQADADAALLDNEVDAVLIDASRLVVKDAASLTNSSLISRLQRAAATVEIERLVATQGQAATDVIEVLTSDPLEATTVTGEGPQDEGQTLVAFAGLMLLYMSILLYGTWILTGVTEEKTNRVVEVLLSAVRPWQILGGKVLGIGVLAVAQLLLIITVAIAAARVTDVFELPQLRLGQLTTLLLWFILGFALFAILFGAAGSLVSRAEDAQTIAFPMSMAAVAGFFASIMTLEDPTGTVAVVGSFFPLTAPFVVPVRAALESIPPWQYGVSVVVAAATVVLLTRIAGRIYKGALLKTTKISIREAWRAAAE